jgi:hypothetical protein
MIFARRRLQKLLNELRPVLGGKAVDDFAKRLNNPVADRMAAIWEVVVIHALSLQATIRNEAPIGSGRRPDLHVLTDRLEFTADVVSVSDEGLDENNPYFALSEMVEKTKTKLGLPVGGVDIRVESTRQSSRRGTKTTLRLPPRSRLQAFVDEEILPRLRDQVRDGEKVLRVAFDDDDVGISITIDPSKSPYSGGSFGGYNIPGIKDKNPLFAGMKRKAEQLRGANGLIGIIVCDGDCRAMKPSGLGRDGFPPPAIVKELFRQYSHVDFVWLITVEEKTRSFVGTDPPSRQLHVSSLVRDGCSRAAAIDALCEKMTLRMPRPIMMPVNGALRAREKEYDLGKHGGYSLGGRKVKVSLREATEVLAGLRTFGDDGAKYVDAARRLGRSGDRNRIETMIQKFLREGRLPVAMRVIPGELDESDDWLEMEFGEPDPAISPFR